MSIDRYLSGRVGAGQVGNRIQVSVECSLSNWRTYRLFSEAVKLYPAEVTSGTWEICQLRSHHPPLPYIQIYSFELEDKCMP
jgi:hypothetical protein